MSDDMNCLSQISIFGCNFSLSGWALCDGSVIAVAQNQALYSLLGDAFGGDLHTNFRLPDLRGRSVVGTGTSLDGIHYDRGTVGGAASVSLQTENLASHSHEATFTPISPNPQVCSLEIFASGADKSAPDAGDYIAGGTTLGFRSPGGLGEPTKVEAGGLSIAGGGNPGGTVSVGATGSGRPIDIRSPYVAIGYQICVSGIYPTRN